MSNQESDEQGSVHDSQGDSSSHEEEELPVQAEQELASKMLQIQSKRYYIDVKQNKRGRFIKIAEVNQNGNKNRLLLAMSAASEFRDHLTSFVELYTSLGPQNQENVPENGKYKSEIIFKDNRRYYLDLKENPRGRFLKVSQTITTNGQRSQIAIPAQGLVEFRNAMTDLLEEYGVDVEATSPEIKSELPEGKCVKVENKSFFFDIGQNNRGVYMRISEVYQNNKKNCLLLGKSSALELCDLLKGCIDQYFFKGNYPTMSRGSRKTNNPLPKLVILKDENNYSLSFKDNFKGKVFIVHQTLNPIEAETQIIIPVAKLKEFYNGMKEFLKQCAYLNVFRPKIKPTEIKRRSIKVEDKSYFFDTSLHYCDYYIQITEVNSAGKKETIILANETVTEFTDFLQEFIELYSFSGYHQVRISEKKIHTKNVEFGDNNHYNFSLKKDSKRQFLVISQCESAFNRWNYANIPAKGLKEFQATINDIVKQCGEVNESYNLEKKFDISKSVFLKISNKDFFFDIYQMDDVTYMKIAENKQSEKQNCLTFEMSQGYLILTYLTPFMELIKNMELLDQNYKMNNKGMTSHFSSQSCRYHLDLMLFSNGWTVKVAQIENSKADRHQIFIPAMGLNMFCVTMLDLLNEYTVMNSEIQPSSLEASYVHTSDENSTEPSISILEDKSDKPFLQIRDANPLTLENIPEAKSDPLKDYSVQILDENTKELLVKSAEGKPDSETINQSESLEIFDVNHLEDQIKIPENSVFQAILVSLLNTHSSDDRPRVNIELTEESSSKVEENNTLADIDQNKFHNKDISQNQACQIEPKSIDSDLQKSSKTCSLQELNFKMNKRPKKKSVSIQTEIIRLKDGNSYFLNFKQNFRGKVLGITQTLSSSKKAAQIFVPGNGLREFYKAMKETLEECDLLIASCSKTESTCIKIRRLEMKDKTFSFDFVQRNGDFYIQIIEKNDFAMECNILLTKRTAIEFTNNLLPLITLYYNPNTQGSINKTRQSMKDPDGQHLIKNSRILKKISLKINYKEFIFYVYQNGDGTFMKITEHYKPDKLNTLSFGILEGYTVHGYLLPFIMIFTNFTGLQGAEKKYKKGLCLNFYDEFYRYFFDMALFGWKGWFLKVAQKKVKDDKHCQIFIPANGINIFCETMLELLNEYKDVGTGVKTDLLEERSFQVEDSMTHIVNNSEIMPKFIDSLFNNYSSLRIQCEVNVSESALKATIGNKLVVPPENLVELCIKLTEEFKQCETKEEGCQVGGSFRVKADNKHSAVDQNMALESCKVMSSGKRSGFSMKLADDGSLSNKSVSVSEDMNVEKGCDDNTVGYQDSKKVTTGLLEKASHSLTHSNLHIQEIGNPEKRHTEFQQKLLGFLKKNVSHKGDLGIIFPLKNDPLRESSISLDIDKDDDQGVSVNIFEIECGYQRIINIPEVVWPAFFDCLLAYSKKC